VKKILIANRGEIAVRIARACADYGAASVAVYADCEFDAVHVRAADEAYALEGELPADTYLNMAKLLEVADRSGADAVHPGYGFLSENARFAQAVIDAGLLWIGPPPHVIEILGDKVQARRVAVRIGAPLAAGTADPVGSAEAVEAFARRHGLPVVIKAAFGGGGRGLRVAWKMDEVRELYESAVREATAAFGRGECFVEQFLDRPRHVEAQVVADAHGKVVVLGTRDCSLQRRHQKLVEEAPAPFLTEVQRTEIHRAARDICAEVGYVGAGTVEFLVSQAGAVSFLEVNTRLQVEHPVTEETCGLDIVVEQLRIADGQPLSMSETPVPRGHAIEFRINAEDVARGFLPIPGRIDLFTPPSGPGVRLDAGVASGSVVSGHFDSLMAKLVVSGATREQAIARARRALAEFKIEGVASVLPFHSAVLAHPDFVGESGFKVHTRWIETEFVPTSPVFRPVSLVESEMLQRLPIEIDGRRVSLGVPRQVLHSLTGLSAQVPREASLLQAEGVQGTLDVFTPVTGKLQSWKVDDGATVKAGELVAIVESMKMEMQVCAHRPGQILFRTQPGASVTAGAALARISVPLER
jgi:acetyl-CoA/propionyl-CoA carboxylase, biotin carboxylase, biotin carboxyl carrier protein